MLIWVWMCTPKDRGSRMCSTTSLPHSHQHALCISYHLHGHLPAKMAQTDEPSETSLSLSLPWLRFFLLEGPRRVCGLGPPDRWPHGYMSHIPKYIECTLICRDEQAKREVRLFPVSLDHKRQPAAHGHVPEQIDEWGHESPGLHTCKHAMTMGDAQYDGTFKRRVKRETCMVYHNVSSLFINSRSTMCVSLLLPTPPACDSACLRDYGPLLSVLTARPTAPALVSRESTEIAPSRRAWNGEICPGRRQLDFLTQSTVP